MLGAGTGRTRGREEKDEQGLDLGRAERAARQREWHRQGSAELGQEQQIPVTLW